MAKFYLKLQNRFICYSTKRHLSNKFNTRGMVLLREKVPNTNYVLFLASFFKQTFFIHLAYIIAMKLGVIIQVIGEKVMYK